MFDMWTVCEEENMIHYIWAQKNMKFKIDARDIDNIHLYRKFLNQNQNFFNVHDKNADTVYLFTRLENLKFRISKLW